MKWHSKASAHITQFAGVSDAVVAIQCLVDGILQQAGTVGPRVDLELLASFQGVRRIDYVDMQGAGRLIPANGGFVVQVNKRHTFARQRFTVAHELCHLFFREAAGVRGGLLDEETALFDIQNEEEYLCDVGASRVLLHPDWLLPMARMTLPSVPRLVDIADECGSSIEATAFQLVQTEAWQCSIVFWELGMRKRDKIPSEQMSFASVIEEHGAPREKLRVARCYASPGAPFLPNNKSVGFNSSIYAALHTSGRTSAIELLDLGRAVTQAECDSDYMPYRKDSGALQPRVVTVVRWP